MECYRDRVDAGKQLAVSIAERLQQIPSAKGIPYLLLALPRGGVAVAVPIAQKLQAPLGVIVAKKITLEPNPELAVGAVTVDGQVVWGGGRFQTVDKAMTWSRYSEALQQARIHAEMQWQEFAPYCPQFKLEGTIVILVDDGIATGMTMAAAVKSVRSHHPAQVWICAPVAPLELIPFLERLCDQLVILKTPSPFYSVSRFYQEFDQVATDVVIEQLQQVNGNNEV